MPRHSAPNHSDCYVDCPDGGFAYYVAPHGPCVTGCNTGQLAAEVIEIIRRFGWSVVASGIVRDMPRRHLREFARRLRQVSQGNQSAEDALDTLENLPPFRDDETVDASWTSVDGVDFVRTLGREASR